MTDIVAINVPERLAFTDDGREVPITNLFDWEGDDVELGGLAVSFVAGSNGEWFTGLIEDYGDQPH